MKLILLILTLIIMTSQVKAQYAVTIEPTPVLNSPDFESVFGGRDGRTVKKDGEGLIREMEYIAFKGTVFEILEQYDKGDHLIYKVKTESYNYLSDLYIDSRFVKLTSEKPDVIKKLPSKEKIYEFLDKAVGQKYCWGGNYINGISKLLEYYQPAANLSGDEEYLWTLKGCDCSGLMYEATDGFTERNTSKLVYFGEPVEIEGKSAEQIASTVKPLDMMVWNGHVIYVYDENTAIQSSLSKGGVVKTDLVSTIQGLMKTRKPVNDYDSTSKKRFVVRRWYRE